MFPSQRILIERSTMARFRSFKPNVKNLQKIVNLFNLTYPVGTKVILRKDSGEVETTVRAPAEILQGHSAVGWFEGVSGCYSIEDDRVRSLSPIPAA
jgi:hypothetical protein